MSKFNKLLLLLTVAVLCDIYTTVAQINIVEKPKRPPYKKEKAKTATEVWIADDWLVQNDTYVWNGDRWVEPPKPNSVWVPGRWKHKHEGWRWIPGRWR